jgi:hypothetical protein
VIILSQIPLFYQLLKIKCPNENVDCKLMPNLARLRHKTMIMRNLRRHAIKFCVPRLPTPLPPDIGDTLCRRTPIEDGQVVVGLRGRDIGPVGKRKHVLVLDALAGVEGHGQVPHGVVARVKGRRHGQAVAHVPAAELVGGSYDADGLAVKVAGNGVFL